MTADTTQAINRTTEPKEVTVVDRAQRCALMLRQGHILPKLKLAELLEDLAQHIIDNEGLLIKKPELKSARNIVAKYEAAINAMTE